MIELFPLAEYLAGVHHSAEIAVPDAARGYRLELARCTDAAPDIWPDPGQLLRVQVELYLVGKWSEKAPNNPRRKVPHSADGWLPWASFDAYGGKHHRGKKAEEFSDDERKAHAVALESGAEFAWPREVDAQACSWLQAGLHVPLPGRKLRAFLITAAPVRTRVTIEVA